MSIISIFQDYLLPSLTGRGRGWGFPLTGRGWVLRGKGVGLFALIREDKLFSAIYIAGTAVAIASAMVVAIFLNIKLADIPPESNRSRTLYPLYGFYTKSLAENGREFDMRYSTAALDSCFRQLKCMEAATGIRSAYLSVNDETQQHPTSVYALCTDPSFFRLYDLDFISGRPFSEKEFRSGERVCIVTDKLAKWFDGAAYVSIAGSKGQFPFRVIGVVKAVSTLMENATADIYIPYTVETDYGNPDQCIDQVSYSGQLDVRLLLREGCSRENFLDEVEPLRRQYNAVMSARLGKEWGEWKIDADTHFFNKLNFFSHADGQNLAMKAKELMPPALLMLLFLLLPAINLSGLVSNRMEARRAEMGIRKAFGGKRRTLLNEVIHENLMLTLLGGAVGWLLSWLFIMAVSNTEVVHSMFRGLTQMGNEPSLDFRMFFTPTLFLVAFVCCAVLNLMAALIPAWHSLRKPIVESLNQKR